MTTAFCIGLARGDFKSMLRRAKRAMADITRRVMQ